MTTQTSTSIKEAIGTVSAADARMLAAEAYIYLYPLVLMDVTRRQATNEPAGEAIGRGPANQFIHLRTFPPATFKDIVRPNFDTLYSSAWLDLTNGPVTVSMPDTNDRYYLLPMLDMWTDVFASPGKRTTGTRAQMFAVVPPSWSGTLPAGVTRIDAPTMHIWIVGRTQTNGEADYPAVNSIQDRMVISAPESSPFTADPAVDMKTPAMLQVESMPAREFFARAAAAMKVNPPHITDQPILARIRRIGIVPGVSFDVDGMSSEIANALEDGAHDALKAIKDMVPRLAPVTNGWQIGTDTMGVYGTSYLRRACVAMAGLGANLPEDAIYPFNLADSDGKPLNGANKYMLHFTKAELPPVDAFWSITVYDPKGFPYPNPTNRCAIGDRDPLQFNADGSLDLYFQHDSPGAQRESNWLPAPGSDFNLTMRLYAPRREVTSGYWAPPPVKRL